mmetsp:Transcript_7021/g.17993  ORF Transcript_7021/g.17993 Transcript_7021/m.17993 type:complete len:102 (+) Transcript_7021:2966-3271(+)
MLLCPLLTSPQFASSLLCPLLSSPLLSSSLLSSPLLFSVPSPPLSSLLLFIDNVCRGTASTNKISKSSLIEQLRQHEANLTRHLAAVEEERQKIAQLVAQL